MRTFLKNYHRSILVVLAVLCLSTINVGSIPKVEYVNISDKLVHAIFYMVIPITLIIDHTFLIRKPPSIKGVAYITAISIAYGILMEVVQYFLPYRSASFYDILANITGTVVALIIYFITRKVYVISCRRRSTR